MATTTYAKTIRGVERTQVAHSPSDHVRLQFEGWTALAEPPAAPVVTVEMPDAHRAAAERRAAEALQAGAEPPHAPPSGDAGPELTEAPAASDETTTPRRRTRKTDTEPQPSTTD